MATPQLSEAAWSVWGKYDRENDTSLALHWHLTDSAAIAELLWDEWLPQSTRKLITEDLGGDDHQARSLVAWLAGSHDAGKATPEFAKQVEPLAGRMHHAGLIFPVSIMTYPRMSHSALGYVILRDWLMDEFDFGRVAASSVAIIAGGHHGAPLSRADLRAMADRSSYFGDAPAWKAARSELLEHITAFSGAGAALRALRTTPVPVHTQALLTAFVILADWIASNTDYFPYVTADDILLDSRSRAARAWEELALPGAWNPSVPPEDADELFRARFSLGAEAVARPVQRAAVEAARRVGTGLLIIEAPMGEGKTEAALMAAEVMAAHSGSGGCLVALPTMATSDALFSRVLDWVRHLPDARGLGMLQSAFLAHSKSMLNSDFAQLRRVRGIGDEQDPGGAPTRLPAAVVEAHQWLSGRKKGVLSNFVVGTIDQVLFGALKSKHVALRHLALANKVVIIDEVHSADAYMSVYLHDILAWLGTYRVPVVLLSATLAPSARMKLVGAYADLTENDQSQLLRHREYPVITAVQRGRAGQDGALSIDAVPPSSRSVEITLRPLGEEDLVSALRAPLEAGAAIAVIRNTVGRAQETARALREAFPAEDVLLVHSRFIASDRINLESALRARLGPQGKTEERGPLIVVGTQVLEQSLDVDFDLMVSDIAPIDLLLQRAGRLHRHHRARRPEGCETATLLISGITDRSPLAPEFDSGASAIYGDHLLLRTALVLENAGDRIAIPGQVAPLVRAVYDEDLAAPPAWETEITEAKTAWITLLEKKKESAAVFALPRPSESGNDLIDWLRAPAEGADEDSPRGQQQVRDSEDSVEVLVAQQLAGEVVLLPWLPNAGKPIGLRFRPPDELAWGLATSSIRLPSALCRGYAIDQTIGALEVNAFEGWQQSALLAGQLVLLLNDDLEAQVGRFHVRYSQLDGLEIIERSEAAR